jgi:methionyl-tRNA formyltransferase
VIFDCVKEFALEKGLEIFQPENLKRENFEDFLNAKSPRMIVVASYGKILPSYVINYPLCGCVNVHASLLPKYRGAAPINRVIMDGEKISGVSLMYMDEGLDTGDIICQSSIEIRSMNAGELRSTLAKMGGELLKSKLDALLEKKLPAEKQNGDLATYANKISADDRPLDFNKPAEEILNRIKGLSPIPGATCTVESSGLKLKILDAEIREIPLKDSNPGELINPEGLKKNTLAIRCADKALILKLVQPEGSKIMDAQSLSNGRKLCYPDKLI